MASVTVIVWEITTTYNAPYDSQGYADGNFIHCILDDVALTLSVQLRSSSEIGGGSLVGSPVSGPSLFFTDGGSSTNTFSGTPTPQPFWTRCNGTTLERINAQNTFPYANLGSTPNASQCQITPVCDLTISDSFTITPASGPSTADGEVVISATSSNGTIEFSMDENFDYGEGQTSGTFSSLVPGDYTIYAKDPIGCTDSIMITIPVTTSYGVKYRFEYDLNTSRILRQQSRIDIEERGYSGSMTQPEDECLGSPPFILRYEADEANKYHPIYYGDAELNLKTSTSGQWAEFFTNDDLKYRVSFYRYESGWVLKYQGFIVPALYSEPYLNPPFYTTINITDKMRSLANRDFLDENGNEFFQNLSEIFIISHILKKTNLGYSIRSCVDLIETTMNVTDNDDVLDQAYVDSRIFYGDSTDDCEKVLTKILEPYGAFIKASEGYFWIIRQENSIGDIAYRQFDVDGVFESSGTFSSLVGIYTPDNLGSTLNNRFIWRDAVQHTFYQRNYGTFNIKHDLTPDNNLIDSGSFELDYITETGGQLGFIDWNVFIAQAGLRYGFEAVKNGESKGAFFFDLENANLPQADNTLYSKTIRVKSSLFDFSFQYYVEPEFTNFPFVRIAYMIKAEPVSGGTDIYLDKFGRWDGGGTQHKNELFTSSYNSWQTFQQRIPAFTSVDPLGYDVTISIFSHNHYGTDASDTDFSDLRDIVTTGQYTTGKKVYYYDETASLLRAYDLRESTESESTPDRVRPTDYSSPTNTKVWYQGQVMALGANQSFVRKVLIDNVLFTQLVLILEPTTYYSDAPNPITYSLVVDEFNSTFTKEVVLGDAPSNDGALQATVPNPEVYRSWLKLSDGTPTVFWKRRDVTEEAHLLELLANDYAAQWSDPTKKLQGVLLGNGFLSPVNSLQDTADSDRKYIILAYELDDKENACRVTLAEVVTGADGLPPPDMAGFTIGFTLGFNA